MKPMNIYVGNLDYGVQSDDLKSLFTDFGNVVSAKVISDMNSGRSKGFGFVEMESEDDGQRAIDELDGSEYQGRKIVVNKAQPKREGGGGGGGGGRGGHRGGNGGGGRGGYRSGPRD